MRPHSLPEHAGFDADFAAAMASFRLPKAARVAVAVSGGADSMALVRLIARWAKEHGISVHALTVDHQLRDAAAAEALQVGAWLGANDIPHSILRWDGGPHARALSRSAQNAAREARYRLMTDWCAANDCSHLFVAHHADDQVETFLLRLSRGSGVDGLAAMAASVRRAGIVIARPLLRFSKHQLISICENLGQAWIEDPSNANTASTRVRFRQARQVLEREGLTRDRLLATVGHLQRARAALDYGVTALLAQGAWDNFGVARLPVEALLAAPEEIALRALARLLVAAGGQSYGPRFESLARLYARLGAGPWKDTTLHGCLVCREGKLLMIMRESAQITDEQALVGHESVIWDERFRLTLAVDVPTATFSVKRLQGDDQQALPESVRSAWGEIPFRVRPTLPVVFDVRGIAAIPHLDYTRVDVAAIPGFRLGSACISAAWNGADVA